MKSYSNEPVKKVLQVMPGMKIKIHAGDILTYWYNVNEEITCEFGLLCEVGEVWKKYFERYIRNNALIIERVDTADYYGERLAGKIVKLDFSK